MDALRLSLLIFGAFVLGGVYLWSSHLQHKRREKSPRWEGAGSHTISNPEVDNADVTLDGDQAFRFTSHGDIFDDDVEKIYTQDIARESIDFSNSEESRMSSHVISDVTVDGIKSDKVVDKDIDKDNPQTPPVFVKSKVYESRLDQTKSHIKAVHEQERKKQQIEQTKSPKSGAKASGNGLVIVINLLARPGLEFKGEKILRSVENSGLKYGDMNIFHYTHSSAVSSSDSNEYQSDQHMFSLTNIVNPGTFDKNKMSTLTTPGLSLFMQLPGPEDGVKTFEKMLNTAQTLKKELDGELCDESRSALTYQTISHIKERIKEYCFKYPQA